MKVKSHKLSNDTRTSIINKIIERAFKEKEDALTERRYELSLKVYNDIYSKKDREAMYALPEGWLPEFTEFQVQFGASSSGYCRRMLKEPKRCLNKHYSRNGQQCLKVYSDTDKLTLEHDKLTKDIDDLKKEVSTCAAEIKAMAYSCNTTKQLKEAWPEIAEFVEQFEPISERSTAIVPAIEGLNARLGFNLKEGKNNVTI